MLRSTSRLTLAAILTILSVGSIAAQQPRTQTPRKVVEKCRFPGITCICSWQWESRPHTSCRGYFITERFWDRINKVCWKEFVHFVCQDEPAKGMKFDRKRVRSPILAAALDRAKKENKLVLFIGLTGG